MKRIFGSFRSLAAVLAVTALLLEGALRGLALLPGKTAGLASDPQLGIVGLPFVSVGAVKTNSAGFNDREHGPGAPAPKAIFIGDSFTFGVTSFHQNFPYLVEARLGGQEMFPVVNLGVPSTGPQEYLAMVQKRAAPLHPEWIIVTLFVGNDVHQAHPNYRTLIFLGETRLLYDPLRLGTRLDAYYLPRAVRKVAKRISWLGSATEETIRVCVTTPETAARLTPFLLGVYSGELVVYEQPDDPLMREAFLGLKRIIAELADSAAAAGTGVLFVIAPSEIQLNTDLQASVLRCLGASSGSYDFTKPQRLLREYLDARKLPYIDLTPAFSRYSTTQTYTLHDTHWSPFGNRVAAESIAASLGELRSQAAPTERRKPHGGG